MLESERNALITLWNERRVLYDQCMDLQLFYRDTEQADTWMAKQEAFLANDDVGDSLDSVEAMIKKHEDFEKSLAAQEEKIKALDEFATKLVEEHYAADDVDQRRSMVSLFSKNSPINIFLVIQKPPLIWERFVINLFFQLLERRSALLEKSRERRALLEDSFTLQQFERDCDETKGWINEKLKFATDDNYLVSHS